MLSVTSVLMIFCLTVFSLSSVVASVSVTRLSYNLYTLYSWLIEGEDDGAGA